MTDPGTAAVRLRQEAYRCLATLFCEPDLDDLLRQRVGDRLRSAVEAWAPVAAATAREAEDALGAAGALDLRRTYARLFVGPGPLAAPPYGSVHLDDGRRLMGASTRRVLEAYAAAGLDVDVDAHEAPDHIAIELEFLQLLDWRAVSAGDADTAEVCLTQRREFLESLVSPWVPALSAAVREAAPASPYAAFATCLEAVVAFDATNGVSAAG